MMKNGVHAPEQDDSDSKRGATVIDADNSSAQEPSPSQSISPQVARNVFSMIFGADTTVESSNTQSTPFHQAPSLRTDGAAENTAMQECFENPTIFVHILRLANNPIASKVSQNFYNPQEEALRLNYNQHKESHRPNFYYDEDKDSNEATAEQQVEVKYLLSHETKIIEKTDNDKTVKACFAKLKEAQYLNIKPVETIKFIAREKFLDELNAAIINVEILRSKRNHTAILGCSGCHLTRFPGKVITQHLDYFKALRKFCLSINKLQSLPREIGQLMALEWLFLSGNQLQSLPHEIGQLAALQGLVLGSNQLKTLPPEIGQLTALQGFYLNDNQLKSLPSEIGQLVVLQWLNLDSNQLQTLPPEIGRLAALQGLYLDHNQLQTLPSEIGQLTALQGLHANHSQLQNLPENLREDIFRDHNYRTITKAQVLASQRKPPSSNGEEVRRTPRP